MSGQLVWECVKKNNSFLRKGLHGVCFSAEAGNLYNSHSYKYSGLTNAGNTMDIRAVDGAVRLSTSRPKNVNKPAKSMCASTTKIGSRRLIKAAGKAAPKHLKRAAKARAAAVAKSLKVKKTA